MIYKKPVLINHGKIERTGKVVGSQDGAGKKKH